MSAPDILAVAKWLQARHGMHVFRIDHPGRPECGGAHRECDGQRGKHPGGRWTQIATRSPRLITAQIAADPPWNIGVAAKLSGLLVVDEDRPGAFASFAASIGEALKPTLTVSTSKGRHYYYRQADGVPLGNARGDLKGLGIDIRGGGSSHGGYVVAPASVHQTGVVYAPLDSSAPVLPVPGWLAEALRPSAAPEPPRLGRPVSTFGALKGLVRVVLEAREGDRNNTLYWSSCRAATLVAEGKVDAGTVTGVLVDAATHAGLPEAEARRTVESGLRVAEAVRHG